MGMSALFAAIDEKTLARIQEDPSLMEDFLYPDNDEGEPEISTDVDKAWHAIHYMLTGAADGGEGILAQAVLGGEPVGEDLGMGPARVLTPQQVKEISAAFSSLSVDEFTARYNPADMTAKDIYPSIIWERDGQEALDYVLTYYHALVAFYQDAAARGDGMVLLIA